MKNKIIKHLLLLVFVFQCAQAEDKKAPVDASFMEFCVQIGGTPEGHVVSNNIVTQGQRCKDAHFGGVYAEDKADAEMACRKYGPYHLVDGREDQNLIKCTYEALVVCRNGYKQIEGRCYKVENAKISVRRGDAEPICKGTKSQIYQHYSERIAAFINIFFPGLSAVWAEIPGDEVLYDLTVVEDGKHYAVVFGTANIYNVGYNSLVKLPDMHYALVLCEYTPKESSMSLRAIVNKWSEHIHTAVVDGAFTAWRTFGYYLPDLDIHDTLFEDHQKDCKRSLSAIMNSTNVKMFDTKESFMNKLGGRLGDYMVFLAPFRLCFNEHHWCSASSAWEQPTVPMSWCWSQNKRNFWKGGYKTYLLNSQSRCHNCKEDDPDKEQRDLNYYMAYQKSGTYEFFATRRRPAPILCDIMFNGLGLYANCDSGWTQYLREDGSKACHLYHTQSITRDAAREYCETHYKARLAGWHSEDELNTILAFGEGWLNMKKDSACRYMSSEEGNHCFEHNAFYDPDDMTNEKGRKAFVTKLASDQPEGSAEYCFSYVSSMGGIHDYDCDVSPWPFTCTKVTELIEGDLNYGLRD